MPEQQEQEPKKDSFDSQTLTSGDMVVIPNPESSDKTVEISLKDPADYRNNDAAYMIDLSWLGFSQPVKISGFSVGNITGSDQAVSCDYEKFYFNEGNRYSTQEHASGSWLVLVVSTSEDIAQADNYIVLLDYGNKKSYNIQTIIPFAWGHSTDIILADVTGDGIPEITVSDTPNGHHTGVVFEVVRFTGNGLKSIYQRDFSGNSEADNYFDVALADNYQAKILCPAIEFSCDIRLSDAGLESNDLEIGIEMQDVIVSPADDSANRCYENGKVVKEGLRVGNLDSITVFDAEKEVKLDYYVYLGRWHCVARISAWLEYDSVDDMLVLTRVEVN
ncbi:MAG: hypothetical protein ACRDBO_00825 [Lachnospiraceae bacterium]